LNDGPGYPASGIASVLGAGALAAPAALVFDGSVGKRVHDAFLASSMPMSRRGYAAVSDTPAGRWVRLFVQRFPERLKDVRKEAQKDSGIVLCLH